MGTLKIILFFFISFFSTNIFSFDTSIIEKFSPSDPFVTSLIVSDATENIICDATTLRRLVLMKNTINPKEDPDMNNLIKSRLKSTPFKDLISENQHNMKTQVRIKGHVPKRWRSNHDKQKTPPKKIHRSKTTDNFLTAFKIYSQDPRPPYTR